MRIIKLVMAQICEVATRRVSLGMNYATAYHFYIAGKCIDCFRPRPRFLWWLR